MKRNPKYRNSFLKHEISNVSRTPFVVTSAPRTPLAITITFIKTARNIEISTTPTGARACCRPISLFCRASSPPPSPSNLSFLLSLPLFPDYRVTIVVTPPERGEHAGTHRPRRRRAEGGRRPPHFAVPLLFLSSSRLPFPVSFSFSGLQMPRIDRVEANVSGI